MKIQVSQVIQQVRAISKRILNLCENKKFLKEERIKSKEMRKKIVGAGNTMDSYGDKFLPLSNLSSDTRKNNEESQKREKEEKLRQQKIYQDKVDDIVVDIKKKEQRQQSLQRIENEANKFNKEKLKKSTTEFNEAAQEDAVFI